MIELPARRSRPAKSRETAEFFSYGTNDLTQTTFGISRDDVGKFLGTYTAKGILPVDPFVSIDREGVGELVRMRPNAAARRGRSSSSASAANTAATRLGRVLPRVGLDYVSCSPFRVPIARLAAAQAAIGKGPASMA